MLHEVTNRMMHGTVVRMLATHCSTSLQGCVLDAHVAQHLPLSVFYYNEELQIDGPLKAHSHTQSVSHSLTQSVTHSLTQSVTHSLTHSICVLQDLLDQLDSNHCSLASSSCDSSDLSGLCRPHKATVRQPSEVLSPATRHIYILNYSS